MADLPKNETVKLITGVNGLMHNPTIVEGETSSTGKTISVEHMSGKTYRLDTEKILSGGAEFRKGAYYKLYTKSCPWSGCRGERSERERRSSRTYALDSVMVVTRKNSRVDRKGVGGRRIYARSLRRLFP